MFKNTTTPSPAFLATFGTERQCRRFLFRLKWATGFDCPKCAHRRALERHGGRTWICGRQGCTYRESATQGTIAESIKKPLRLWFLGLWLYAHAPEGMTAKQLQKDLGLGSYQTAWTWCQKFRDALSRSPNLFTRTGEIYPPPVVQEAPPSMGIHGWSGGGKSLARLLPPRGHDTDLTHDFRARLRNLYVGRVSAKHGRAYWAEYALWSTSRGPSARWREISNRLAGPSVPYWQIVKRPARGTPLACVAPERPAAAIRTNRPAEKA